MITIDEQQKAQQKAQRLTNLAAQWFELEMNRVAYEANSKTQQVEDTVKLQVELETSYAAIEKM